MVKNIFQVIRKNGEKKKYDMDRANKRKNALCEIIIQVNN